MKLLLTSNGLSNKSIANAFVELVGKKPNDIKVAFIPTAGLAVDGGKDWLIDDLKNIQKLGCYIDIIDIAQLRKDEWLPRVEICDVIFVGGGSTFYLSYWLQESGLFDLLPKLLETRVYAGISAGSMITGASLVLSSEAISDPSSFEDKAYDLLGPTGRSSAKTLQFVDFIFRPHLNASYFPLAQEDLLKEQASHLEEVVYGIDDNSALKIVDGAVEVVSEGEWILLNKE